MTIPRIRKETVELLRGGVLASGLLKCLQIVIRPDHVVELLDRTQHVAEERRLSDHMPVEQRVLVDPVGEVVGGDWERIGTRQANGDAQARAAFETKPGTAVP